MCTMLHARLEKSRFRTAETWTGTQILGLAFILRSLFASHAHAPAAVPHSQSRPRVSQSEYSRRNSTPFGPGVGP